jgi:ketosteroid isomerase-like protein
LEQNNIYLTLRQVDNHHIKNDTEPPEAQQQTIIYENFRARLYGKTAVVNYLLVVKGRSNDRKDYTNSYRTSVIWVKQNGNWRIINFHATRVRP